MKIPFNEIYYAASLNDEWYLIRLTFAFEN